MKNNKVITAALLLVCLAFVSACTAAPRKYTSLVADVANDETQIDMETDQWNGEYFKEACEKELTRTALDASYSGVYHWSVCEKFDSYNTDVYECENGVAFGVRHDDGSLVYLNLMTTDFFATEPFLDDIPNSEEASIDHAKQVAAQFLPDINEYTMIVEEPGTCIKEKDGRQYSITYYKIAFVRTVSGYNSSDYIVVKVTSKGNIASILVGDVGAFDGRRVSIDENELSKSIEDKIAEVYAARPYTVVSYETGKQFLVLSKNGRVCICSEVSVTLREGSGEEIKTGIRLITYVSD